MAIGSVKELIDYEHFTREIASSVVGDASLDDLNDVTVTSPTNGQVLKWDGTKWVNGNDGGTQTSLQAIADEYNPNRNTAYPNNDMVLYEEKLYRSNQEIPVMIGEYDETMWSEIPDYDPTETYQGATKVVHEGTPYKKNPMVPSVTGEWNSDYWFEITPTDIENYDPTSTTVYDALEDDGTFLQTNSSFAKTGGVGAFDSTKWTETTVEQCLSNINVPTIQKQVSQVCTDGEIRTDANGYLTNSLPACSFTWDIVQAKHGGGMPVMGTTVMLVTEYGILNGSNTVRIRVLDANGDPMASITEGISDMGAITITYLAFTSNS